MNYTDGHWNVSLIYFLNYYVNRGVEYLIALARIALDLRMGCLDETPPPDTQRLIDSINTFFINVPILELKIPFWRILNTPTFRKYIEALDSIRE